MVASQIATDVPARIDRPRWSRFHLLVVIALGVTWILDGLEVIIIGSIGLILKDRQTLPLSDQDIGSIAACYVAGAVIGALFFGWLTDRFGRRLIFNVTLGIYMVGVLLTAFARNVWSFAVFNCLAGFGIGPILSAMLGKNSGRGFLALSLMVTQAYLAVGVMLSLAASASAAGPWSSVRQVVVVMVDNRFQPYHLTFQSGTPAELRLENHGKEMHEFTAPGFLRAAIIRDKSLLSNGATDIVVQPGQVVQVRLIPGPAGDYGLTCADHDWDGMVGSISVVP